MAFLALYLHLLIVFSLDSHQARNHSGKKEHKTDWIDVIKVSESVFSICTVNGTIIASHMYGISHYKTKLS